MELSSITNKTMREAGSKETDAQSTPSSSREAFAALLRGSVGHGAVRGAATQADLMGRYTSAVSHPVNSRSDEAHAQKAERPERPEKPKKAEKADKAERPAERAERPQQAEGQEKAAEPQAEAAPAEGEGQQQAAANQSEQSAQPQAETGDTVTVVAETNVADVKVADTDTAGQQAAAAAALVQQVVTTDGAETAEVAGPQTQTQAQAAAPKLQQQGPADGEQVMAGMTEVTPEDFAEVTAQAQTAAKTAKPEAQQTADQAARAQAAQLAAMAGEGDSIEVTTEAKDAGKPVSAQTTAQMATGAVDAQAVTGLATTGEDGADQGTQQQAGNKPQGNQGLVNAGQRLAANGALENAQAATEGKAAQSPAFQAALNAQTQGTGDAKAAAGAQPQLQGVGQATAANNTAATQKTQAAQQPQAPRAPQQPHQPVVDQVKVQIQDAVKDGVDKITISLKPAELGRIEVKLEVRQDGQVTANIVADKPETLELLQKDAKDLAKSLQNAGLDANGQSLNFSLRHGEGQQGQAQNGQGQGSSRARLLAGLKDDDGLGAQPMARQTVADGRVDIQV